MRTRGYLLLSVLLVGAFLFPTLWQAHAQPSRGPVRVERSVVQIIAVDEGRRGQLLPKWTGTGTIISADGLILTNCQVAMPRAIWDDPDFDYDLLIVALTNDPDEPPEAAYLAEVVQYDANLDLAVLRITQTLDGSTVNTKRLRLPALSLGDSDALATGDALEVFGYTGLAREPISSVSGSVKGFSTGRGIRGRAWIRTDAEVEGGFSGAPAMDEDGKIVGIVAAGAVTSADDVLHCRYTGDTNRDGVVDQNDNCTPTGGSISNVRPINLAQPLINAAASALGPEPTPVPQPRPTRTPSRPTPAPSAARFGPITFAEGVRNDNPVRPGTAFRGGIKELYAFFDYEGMRDGLAFTRRWLIDGRVVVDKTSVWDGGESGNFWVGIYSDEGLPEGVYALQLFVEGELLRSGSCTVGGGGARPTPTPQPPAGGVEIYGRITDAETGRGIPGAYFLVLQPGITVEEFDGDESQVYTQAVADRKGDYRLPLPLARGESYSIIVAAQGYRTIAEDDVYVPEDAESSIEVNVELRRVR